MARKPKKPRKPTQLLLARTAGHGGARAGAGRKKKEGRRDGAHVARGTLAARTPVHVTLRACAGRPSLRSEVIRAMFEEIRVEIRSESFQVVEFSLQHDHVHMICEQADERALSKAMRRLTIRLSLGLNALFARRTGKNWSGRYHRHDLRTPREVRNALVYVLMNGKKHGEAPRDARWLDPFSSAPEFDGWMDAKTSARHARAAPRSWLLGVGWRRHGLLSSTEAPGGRLRSQR